MMEMGRMTFHVMGREYCTPGAFCLNFIPDKDFSDFLSSAFNSGMSEADVQVEINKYLRMNSKPEMIFPSKEESCKEWSDVTDSVWDELLARYDIDNLNIPEKKSLADDLLDKGVISQIDRDRFVDMLNRKEEQIISPPQSPAFSDYFQANVQNTLFGSGLSETVKDNIFASFDFDHLINHIKDYARNKR